jgi:hypothetical protein
LWTNFRQQLAGGRRQIAKYTVIFFLFKTAIYCIFSKKLFKNIAKYCKILQISAKLKKILQKNKNMLKPDYMPLAMKKRKSRINHYEKKSNQRSDCRSTDLFFLQPSERFGYVSGGGIVLLESLAASSLDPDW